MRGRILLTIMTVTVGAAALAACSKRDSLYIEPGKDERAGKHQPAAVKPEPAKP